MHRRSPSKPRTLTPLRNQAFRQFLYTAVFLLLAGVAVSCGDSNSETLPTPDDPVAARGFDIFQDNCTSCHSLEPEKVIVGPSLMGVGSRAATRMDGLNAREYIQLSIKKPDEYIVDGFSNLMPKNISQVFSSEELDALVTFLLTLK